MKKFLCASERPLPIKDFLFAERRSLDDNIRLFFQIGRRTLSVLVACGDSRIIQTYFSVSLSVMSRTVLKATLKVFYDDQQ